MFRRILSILLIAVIGLLIINKVVFTHTHILDDGRMVTHAHPYSSNTGETHHHSNVDYMFFTQLGLLFFVAAFILKGINITYNSVSIFRKHNLLRCIPFYTELSDRAPPAIV